MTTPLPIRMPFARKNVATAMLASEELCRARECICSRWVSKVNSFLLQLKREYRISCGDKKLSVIKTWRSHVIMLSRDPFDCFIWEKLRKVQRTRFSRWNSIFSLPFLPPAEMLKYRIVLAAAIAAMVLCESCCQAGPARSLASVVTARAAKIPRSIRAPFRNTEMMTARGFGKRSQAYRDGKGTNPLIFDMLSSHRFLDVDTPWSPGKPNHSYSEETYGNELAENTLDR